jgi:hypothetical protein
LIRIIITSFLLSFSAVLFSQDDSGKVNIPAKDTAKINIVDEFVAFSDTSELCDLYLKGKVFLKDVHLLLKNDSTLLAIKQTKTRTVSISDIRKMVFKTPAPFWTGYLAGSVIGFLGVLVPVMIASAGENSESGDFGLGLLIAIGVSVPAGLIGGGISFLASPDDTYLFEAGTTTAKTKRIKYLLMKHTQ